MKSVWGPKRNIWKYRGTRISSFWHCLHFGQIVLCCGGQSYPFEDIQQLLWLPSSRCQQHFPQTEMPLDIAKCPLGAKITPVGSHCYSPESLRDFEGDENFRFMTYLLLSQLLQNSCDCIQKIMSKHREYKAVKGN